MEHVHDELCGSGWAGGKWCPTAPPSDGDPRRCARHPGVAISSPDGLFDAPCGACEAEIDHGYEYPDPWPVGEARYFERTTEQDGNGRRDAWTQLDACLCRNSKPETWTAGVHHGVHRCARVVTRLEVVTARR